MTHIANGWDPIYQENLQQAPINGPPGVHTIKVKARDEYGAESNWSDHISLIMSTYTIRPIIRLIEKIIQWELIPLGKL